MRFKIEGQGENIVIMYLGYAQDPTPFYYINSCLPPSTALAFIWEHHGDVADLSALSRFKRVRLIAWSMGVMLAPIVLSKLDLNFEKRYAVNGSVEGIDDQYGIAPALWDKTFDSLQNETQSELFYRLMCFNKKVYREYAEHHPDRKISDLRTELRFIKEFGNNNAKAVASFYDEAFISKNDLIMSPDAVKASFLKEGVIIHERPTAHYDQEIFKILCARSFS